MAGTSDNRHGGVFPGELACYALAGAPFHTAAARSSPASPPVRPPLASPAAAGRIANTPLAKV